MKHFALACVATAVVSTAAVAQQPRIGNAKLQTRSAAAGLEREFRPLADQTGPLWIGYHVPVVAGGRVMCCFDSGYAFGGSGCCAGCQLEHDRSGSVHVEERPSGAVPLERSHFVVLFRIEGRLVDRVRAFSQDCELEAGGLPVYWLEGVKPTESIALLTTFVTSERTGNEDARGRRVAEGAMGAVALHADPAADRAFEQFIAAERPERLRKRATFWLGSARGARGYQLLQQVLKNDPSDAVREQATFGLSVSNEPGALETLIATAHSDRSTKVRGQALFWLAQKAGKKAADTITSAIENDPETDVKKRAVFALSQLPKDEGVPLLIQVARTNRNPAVRKQAIFWLGQSKDPRALAFFEDVLLKK